MALIKTVRGKTPVYGEGCFFAENATLIGDIMLGDNCSVWFNTVVRGDVNSIHVGNSTNIQDGAVIHGTYKLAKTVIGNSVSIGHNALIHGCTIKDHVLIGMGAIVMDNAIIGPYSLIAAGSVVLAETVIPARSVYAGIPARKVKDIDDRLIEVIKRTALNYPEYASWYHQE